MSDTITLKKHPDRLTGAGCAAIWAIVIGIIPVTTLATAMLYPQLGVAVFIVACASTLYGRIAAYANRKGV